MRIFVSVHRKELLKLSIPIIVQSLLTVAMTLVDSLMVAPLGSHAIAGMGVATAIFFLVFSFQLGVANGTQILMSQALGSKNDSDFNSLFIFGVVINLILSLFICLVILLNPTRIICIYTKSSEIINLAHQFLSLSVYIIPITALTLSIGFMFRAQGKTIIPMKGFACELFLNILLNLLFIYGYFGFPALGLKGAALSSLLARSFRLLYLAAQFFRYNQNNLNRFVVLTNLSFKKWWRYFSLVNPFIISSICLALGSNIYQIIFAHLTINDYTAYSLLLPWLGIAFTVINSIASASSIQVSRALGSGNFVHAETIAKTCLSTSIIIGVILAIFFISIIPYDSIFYHKMSKDIIDNFDALVPLSILLIIIKSFNITLMNGILRSGADNRFTLQADIYSQWFVGIPLCFLMVTLLHWHLKLAFSAMIIEEFIKLLPLYFRYKGAIWLRVVTS